MDKEIDFDPDIESEKYHPLTLEKIVSAMNTRIPSGKQYRLQGDELIEALDGEKRVLKSLEKHLLSKEGRKLFKTFELTKEDLSVNYEIGEVERNRADYWLSADALAKNKDGTFDVYQVKTISKKRRKSPNFNHEYILWSQDTMRGAMDKGRFVKQFVFEQYDRNTGDPTGHSYLVDFDFVKKHQSNASESLPGRIIVSIDDFDKAIENNDPAVTLI